MFSRLTLRQDRMRPLQEYLLPEDDPHVQDTLAKALSTKGGSEQDSTQVSCSHKWMSCHFELTQRTGQVWGRSQWRPQFAKIFPFYNTLTPREQDHLALWGVSFPDVPARVKDLSQAPNRSQEQLGCFPCITPRGKFWVSSVCRFITGLEKCRVQNLWFPEQMLREFDSAFLGDLAGAC